MSLVLYYLQKEPKMTSLKAFLCMNIPINKFSYFTFLSLMLLLASCKPEVNSQTNNLPLASSLSEPIVHDIEPSQPIQISRDQIIKNLEVKNNLGLPLVVHIYVPLCDNEHQGIVPVNSRLGDGFNLRTNLYWGAGYGMKSHFKLHTDWKLVTEQLNHDSNILERIVYYKEINDNKVYMVADAYRGDKMKPCLNHYFDALSGTELDSVLVGSTYMQCGSAADLIVFNGHNGLMDTDIDFRDNVDGIQRDAVAICCISNDYFKTYFEYLNAYPLVLTTNFMAPEAYVMEGLVEAWAQLKTPEEIKNAAGDAYAAKHSSCSPACGRRLFETGW